jgi:hypothetical protein
MRNPRHPSHSLAQAADPLTLAGDPHPSDSGKQAPEIHPLMGRKSVLMGMAGSMGLVLATRPSSATAAGTTKPSAIAATQTYVPKWTPDTAYVTGQQVVSPNNDVVSTSVAHTSGSTFNAANWSLSTTYGQLPAAADKVVFVTSRGSDANDGKSLKSAFLTLGAAYAALGGPGRIQCGYGTLTLPASLDVSSSSGVTIEGVSGNTAGASPGTIIRFTGTGTGAAINAGSSIGFTLKNVMLLYSSSSFTGRLVDLRTLASQDTNFALVDNCYLGSSGGITTADAIIDMSNSHSNRIMHCSIRNGVHGIRGRAASGNYANAISIRDCYFRDNSTAHISNPGDGWTIQGCTWEPLASGAAGAVICDAGVSANGLTILGGWAGDVVVSAGGIQFDLTGNAINIIGTLIGGQTGSTGVKIRNNASGVFIAAAFNSPTTGIDLGGVLPTNFDCSHSSFTFVTTPLTAGYQYIQVDSPGGVAAIQVRNSGTKDGQATIRYVAQKTTVQVYDAGIDPGGGTVKEFAIRDITNARYPFVITKTGSVIAGNRAALTTTAVDGFLYIPTCAGPPTGVPTAQSGMVPMIFDSTNSKFYLYNAGWKGVVVT